MNVYETAQHLAEQAEELRGNLEGLATAIDEVDDLPLAIDSHLSDVNERDTAEELFQAINKAIGLVNEARVKLRV